MRILNQTIELPEATEAYRNMGYALAIALKNGLPPDDVLAFFTFMMKYGDTPFSMFGGKSASIIGDGIERIGVSPLIGHAHEILNQLSKFLQIQL